MWADGYAMKGFDSKVLGPGGISRGGEWRRLVKGVGLADQEGKGPVDSQKAGGVLLELSGQGSGVQAKFSLISEGPGAAVICGLHK